MRYQKYQKIYIYIDIWEIILYRETNPSRLKTKNISSLTFIRTNINVDDSLFKTKLQHDFDARSKTDVFKIFLW